MANVQEKVVEHALDAALETFKSLKSERSIESAIDAATKEAFDYALQATTDHNTANSTSLAVREALISHLLARGELDGIDLPEVNQVRVKIASMNSANDTYKDLVSGGVNITKALDQATDSAYQSAIDAGASEVQAKEMALEVRDALARSLIANGEIDELGDVDGGAVRWDRDAGNKEKEGLDDDHRKYGEDAETGRDISDSAQIRQSGDQPNADHLQSGQDDLLLGADSTSLSSGDTATGFELPTSAQGESFPDLDSIFSGELGSDSDVLDVFDEPISPIELSNIPGDGKGDIPEIVDTTRDPFDNLSSSQPEYDSSVIPNGKVVIAASQTTVLESDVGKVITLSFIVTRSHALGATSVDWSLSGDLDADDFGGEIPAGAVEFAAGELEKTIRIDLTGDRAIEADESMTVSLSNPGQNLKLGEQTSAQSTVINDDGVVNIHAGQVSVLEGDKGGSTSLTFTVTRSNDLSASSVDWSLSGDLDADDFGGEIPAGTVEFVAGELEKTITIDLAGDRAIEVEESVTVSLSNPGQNLNLGEQTSVQSTVINDDGVVNIHAGQVSVLEGDKGGSTSLTFTVTRSNDLSASSVDWSLSGDLGADDFGGEIPAGTVEFAAGELEKTITIDLTGDHAIEADESMTVSLSNPGQNLNLGEQTSAQSTVINDDKGFELTTADQIITEGALGETKVLTFIVTRNVDMDQAAQINFKAVLDGLNPVDASDFVTGQDLLGNNDGLPSGVVEFAAGESQAQISIEVSGDNLAGLDEQLAIVLSDAPAGTHILKDTAHVVIETDDALASITTVTPLQSEGTEQPTAFTFTVTRSGELSSATQLDYVVKPHGDAAASIEDFAGISWPTGTVEFAAGEASATVTVEVLGDSLLEGFEDFKVELQNPGANLEIQNGEAVASIRQDTAVSIKALDAVLLEGNHAEQTQSHTFEIVRSGDLDKTTTVNWGVQGGGDSPANAVDFGGSLPAGTVVFLAGETRKIVTITPTADTQFENSENYDVVIDTAPGTVVEQSTARGTIIGDESGIAISSTGLTVIEGDTGVTLVTFTITRSGVTHSEASADWALTPATLNGIQAADFSDGIFPSGRVVFAEGEQSKNITFSLVTDSRVEVDEAFDIHLSNPSDGAALLVDKASGVVKNDDAGFTLVALDACKAEGQTGQTLMTFKVVRSGDLSESDSVEYVVQGVSADSADFGGQLPSGLVQFAPGQTEATFTVAVSADNVIESSETFTVALRNPSQGSELVDGAQQVEATINDDDDQLSIAPLVDSVNEGGESGNSFTFEVTRTGNLDTQSTVNWSLAGTGLTAAQLADFVETSGQLVFDANVTSQLITITTQPDYQIEGDEGFTVTLEHASPGTTIAQSEASGLIVNDDIGLAISPATVNQIEGNSDFVTHTFTVTRTGITKGETSVGWNITGIDTANVVTDTGTVVFAANETVKTIEVKVKGDTDIEPNQNFTVTLSNASAHADITKAEASSQIINDDAGLSITAVTADQTEGNNGTSTVFQFKVERSGDLTSSVQTNWSVSGDLNAMDFLDGQLPSGTVTFAAGETVKFVNIVVNNDVSKELDETLTVNLSEPSVITGEASATVALVEGSESASVKVLNDDAALEISAESGNLNESAVEAETEFTYTITRSGDTTGETTVDWRLTGEGVAKANVNDFVAQQDQLENNNGLPSGSVTFAANETEKTITVTVKGDSAVELDEGFNITLENESANTELTVGSVSSQIINDDSGFSVRALDEAQFEGHTGFVTYTFEVVRAGGTAQAGTVDWTIAGAIDASDIVGGQLSGTLSFDAGVARELITIQVVGDALVEQNESFDLVISNAVSGSVPQTIVDSTASAEILNDDNGFTVATDIASVVEADTGSTELIFTVTRTGGASGEKSVDYQISGDVDAADFVGNILPAGTLIFADGESEKVVKIQVAGDLSVEAAESLSFDLSFVKSDMTTGTDSAVVSIENNDAAYSIVAGAAEKAEGHSGTTAYTFTVTRSGDLSEAGSVNWSLSGDVNAADFGGSLPSGTVEFSANQETQTITINVAGDSLVEQNENLTVNLSKPVKGVIETASATSVVVGDDNTFAISATESDVSEQHTGTTPITFEVTRTGPAEGSQTVSWNLSGTDLTIADFDMDASDFANSTSLNGTVTFADGVKSQTITLYVLADTLVENDETLSITLVEDSASGVIIDPANATASTVINNDDAVVNIVAELADKNEGHVGNVPFTFTINREGFTNQSSTVEWKVQGTGSNDTDSTDFATPDTLGSNGGLPSGSVTFAPGEASKTITIYVAADSSKELDETFDVVVSNPSTGTIIGDKPSAVGTIRNDDAEVNITTADITKAEGDTGYTIYEYVVTRDGNTELTSTVDWNLSGLNSSDIEGNRSGTLTFADGVTSQSITIKVKGDTQVEGDEAFTVNLSSPSTGTGIGSNSSAIGTIINNDDGIRFSSTATQSQAEGQDGTTIYTWTIERYGDTQDASTARILVRGINGEGSETYANAADFQSITLDGQNLTLGQYNDFSFAAGETSKTLTFTVKGDIDVENDEWFDAILYSGSSGNPVDQISNNYVRGEITRDEAQIRFANNSEIVSQADHSAKAIHVEGDDGGYTEHTFVLRRDFSTDGEATVDWKLSNGRLYGGHHDKADTNADDFVAGQDALGTNGGLPSGTVTFADGAEFAYITVKTVSDDLGEADEIFNIQLSNPSAGNSIANSTYSQGFITSDDTFFKVNDPTITEGDGGTTPMTFTVTRGGDATGTDTVDWVMSLTGTALTNEDNKTASEWYKLDPSDIASIVDENGDPLSFTPGSQILNGTLSFADGETSKQITLNIVNDDLTETYYERATLQLSNPQHVPGTGDEETPGIGDSSGYLSDGSGTGRVNDDDANPLITIETSQTEVLEGTGVSDTADGNELVFVVKRNFTADGQDTNDNLGDYPTTVAIRISGLYGSRYNELNIENQTGLDRFYEYTYEIHGYINFLPGQFEREIRIPIAGDNDISSNGLEGDRNVRIDVISVDGPAAEDGNQFIDIKVKEDDIRIWTDHFGDSTQTAQGKEGDSGITDFSFRVNRAGRMDNDFDLTYTITNGTTSNDDFAQMTGTVTIKAGQSYTDVVIPLLNGDTVLESNETFTLTLSDPTDSNVEFSRYTYDTSGSDSLSIAGTIETDDLNYSIAANTATQQEGDTGAVTSYTFTVTRDGGASGYLPATTIQWFVAGTGAEAANLNTADFVTSDVLGNGGLPSGTVSFGEGELTATVIVHVRGDIDVENSEQFQVTISNPSEGTVVGATANSTIVTDDTGVSISDGSIVTEGDTGSQNVTFTVTRSGDITQSSTMDWNLLHNGTDISDFVGELSGHLTFAANQASQTITIAVAGDTVLESAENFSVQLSNFTGIDHVIDDQGDASILNNDATYQIVATDADKAEDQTLTFTITRDRSTPQDQVIEWSVAGSGDNAVNADDFSAGLPTGTVTFSEGELTKTITITPSNDLLAELDESLQVTIKGQDGSEGVQITADKAIAEGWIRNDDAGLELSVIQEARAEGHIDNSYIFVVTRTGSATGTATVDWAVSGTDIDSDDFIGAGLPSGSISFADGETQKEIHVPIAGDALIELDESFSVTLSNATNAQIVVGSASATLSNDDAQLSIAATDAVKAEGDSGTTDYTFTVTRTGDLTDAVSADWVVTGLGPNAADANDFGGFGASLPSGTVQIKAGEATALITIAISADVAAELDEDFTVTLSNPSAGVTLLSGQESANGTIQTDDVEFNLTALTPATLAEGNQAADDRYFEFTVTRDGNLSGTQTVTWNVAGTGADATNDADFDAITGTVTFAADETEKTIRLNIAEDKLSDADIEQFEVSIEVPAGSQVGTGSLTGSIIDDEASLRIEAVASEKAEGSADQITELTFKVVRSGNTDLEGTVDWAVSGMPGLTADDFVPGSDTLENNAGLPSGQIKFGSGESEQIITVQVHGDSLVESDESLTVTLSNGFAGSVLVKDSAQGKILADDSDWSLSLVSSASQTEGDSGVTVYTFEVTRDGGSYGAASVDWSVAGSGLNAADANDFLGGFLPSGLVSLASGQTSTQFEVKVATDRALELDEQFTVTISNADGADTDNLTVTNVDAVISNDDDVFSIVPLDSVKAEGSDNTTVPYSFTVNREGNLDGLSTVAWRIVALGSGTMADDFVADSGVLTFTDGMASQTLTLEALADRIVETDESFTVELYNPGSGSTVKADQYQAMGTIENDDVDLSIIPIANTQVEGDIGGGQFVYKVIRDGDTSGITTVDWSLTGAVNAADFDGPISGTVTFNSTETEQFITLNVKPDGLNEGDEAFNVVLTNPAHHAGHADINVASQSGTIVNDDDSFSISAIDTNKAEANAGFTEFTFRIDRTGSQTGEASVDWNVSGIGKYAADSDDFSVSSGSVHFADGESYKLVTVRVNGDQQGEYDEGFAVQLSNASFGSTIVSGSASAVIINDDAAYVISADHTERLEADDGIKTDFTFTVTRSGDTTQASSVEWQVQPSGDTPAQALDFGGYLPSGVVSFGVGETSKTIVVTTFGDDQGEFDEAFDVLLTNPTNGDILQDTATSVIKDDDTGLTIIARQADHKEGTDGNLTEFTFEVIRTGDISGESSVDWAVTGSNTYFADGKDFHGGVLPSGSLRFEANQASQLVTIIVLGDSQIGNDEGFTVTLSEPVGATLITDSAQGIIRNDDSEYAIVANTVQLDEADTGTTTFSFTVDRSGDSTSDSQISWRVVGNGDNPVDAEDFVDGVLPSGVLDFAADQLTQTLSINVQGDAQLESLEGFRVELVATADNTTIKAGHGSAAALISNDDKATMADDVLVGSAGADNIAGLGGNDTLTGSAGADRFIFDDATQGVDLITDFAPAQDTLVLNSSGFGGLGLSGPLESAVQGFDTDVNTTLSQLAAQADSDVYKLDFAPGQFTLGLGNDGNLDELEAAITASGEHSGSAIFAVSNGDNSTHIYFDADTENGDDGNGLIKIAELENVQDATQLPDSAIVSQAG